MRGSFWPSEWLNPSASGSEWWATDDGPAIFNIVDDEPAPIKVWLPELARIPGAKPPMRTEWTAELGFETYLRDVSCGPEVWDRILEEGRPFEICPTGPSDIRRMETGIFNWGPDFNWRHNPFEVTGLECLVEDQDGGYLGKKVLEGVRREGVSRKLVGIEDWRRA